MIEFRDIDFCYSPHTPILRGVSFTLRPGTITLLVGQNGAGKSTTLKLMNGILRPAAGTILLNGVQMRAVSTHEIAKTVCITFQDPANQLVASTVRSEVAFAPKNLHRANIDELTQRALEMFQLDELAGHHPYDLPPALRKLLTIASAVASDAAILAFDEPTAGLSQPERTILLPALQRLKEEGRTLLLISHDLDLLIPLADSVLALGDRTIVFDGSPGDLVTDNRAIRRSGIRLPTIMRLQRLIQWTSTQTQGTESEDSSQAE